MRLDFTIGCDDCRWTSRRRQSIHCSRIQVFFLVIMCFDARESTTIFLSSGLRVGGAGRIRLCRFCTLIDIVTETAIVSFLNTARWLSIANNFLDFFVHAVLSPDS